MQIDTKTVYEQAFQAHRHASDYRAKIVGCWVALYTAFASVFVWTLANHRALVWVVAVAAVLLTILMWAADFRNQQAIDRAKAIGEELENSLATFQRKMSPEAADLSKITTRFPAETSLFS